MLKGAKLQLFHDVSAAYLKEYDANRNELLSALQAKHLPPSLLEAYKKVVRETRDQKILGIQQKYAENMNKAFVQFLSEHDLDRFEVRQKFENLKKDSKTYQLYICALSFKESSADSSLRAQLIFLTPTMQADMEAELAKVREHYSLKLSDQSKKELAGILLESAMPWLGQDPGAHHLIETYNQKVYGRFQAEALKTELCSRVSNWVNSLSRYRGTAVADKIRRLNTLHSAIENYTANPDTLFQDFTDMLNRWEMTKVNGKRNQDVFSSRYLLSPLVNSKNSELVGLWNTLNAYHPGTMMLEYR